MGNLKTYIFNFVKSAASFAAYAITLMITQDASAATALHHKNKGYDHG